MKQMELTIVTRDGKWRKMENLLHSNKNKSIIEEQLRKLLEKHFVRKEVIGVEDSKLLFNIYQEVFETADKDLDIDEHSDQFVDDFLGLFKLFGLSSAFKKFQTKEDLSEQEESTVIIFADKFTTCTLNEAVIASKTDNEVLKERGKEVVEIVKKCYIHSHTKSCRKYHTDCRYGIPKFPIWRTIIAKPMKISGEEGEKLKKKYSKVLKDVKEVLEDKEAVQKYSRKISN